ncbi:hypothetical protein YQE_12530, partial [Dendroctonus ponderosae]|uniref:BolA-like protein n=1 Tax=Dendroctonus ponderosae TaxID=77166 RepID=J3JW03_DENPD
MIHPKFSIRALLNIIRTLDYQMSTFGQPVEAAITSKLQSSLAPSYLKIINESYMHNVSKGAETHFKVIVVTEKFNNLSLIKRHRKINDLLKDELQGGVHALSIVAKTPDQWTNDEIEPSPSCRGGFGK